MSTGRRDDPQDPYHPARSRRVEPTPDGRRRVAPDALPDYLAHPRQRVPNRPAPARARSAGERRPSTRVRRDDRSDDRPGEGPELIGARAGSAAGTSRTTSSSRGTAGRQTAAPRQRTAPPTGAVRAPAGPAPRTRPARTASRKKAVSQRGRRTRRDRGARVNHRLRTRGALGLILVLLTVALGKLITIQTVDSKALALAGLDQKQYVQNLHALRGSIDDRTGAPLAFTIAGKLIAAHPASFQNDAQRSQVADILVAGLGSAVNKQDLMTKLKSKKNYVYLARDVLPAVSAAMMAKVAKVLVLSKADKALALKSPADGKRVAAVQKKLVNAVVTENQDIRTQPGDGLAAAVVGTTYANGHGQAGIESKFDALLTGKDGSRTLQLDSNGVAIPDTVTKLTPAMDGTSITLTLDQDLQYSVQQYLQAQVNSSQARSGCAVVKGISDGQIYAMACFQPGKTAAEIGNPAVSTPFEPGSVNKVVTFAAALDRGLISPNAVLSVDGQISMGGRNIHDAWAHGAVNMTATGILAKSSNVGTLMIAQKLGPSVFAQELAKYNLGRKTGIELPGESAGSYPAQAQWSATSFANLPIGQGISMTLLQLVDMYQAIGNKGVMVSPTIIAGTTKAGVYTPTKIRATAQVMKPTTATTLLGMLRGTVQGGNWYHDGTAPKAAIPGYQVAGKTGTAQQVDPVTKSYSPTLTNATFAGVVPADNPKFAIAIMIDAPVNGSEGGDSAAPLFHKIASYALRAYDVPPSATAAPVYDLYTQNQ
ncbi:cell division protein FtsI (penicillin-binding protein 3) [Nakamurella sp. UYEF19]|uniref:peptidoglycan D,D-transpeptidase FtsI family protein n=1 Tax=Nakamurella sp. UYEF19 TaxID=1756392 RepID=UPI0033988A8A